jgi:predicted glycoside hydrolase/deacetylase ChbG (UPF0249 family)
MLIINADDFARTRLSTDKILTCFSQGNITSASAMVLMEDSQRAAELAREYRIDAGLHLNFTQELTLRGNNSVLGDYHERIINFLTKKKYNFLIYNPGLHKQFEYVFRAQLEEFERLYGRPPSHIDGHHHMHLCANMLIAKIIPEGQIVRRNFSFARGEKSLPNRMYRAVIDKWLARRYKMTDYLFSLSECFRTGRLWRALGLARTSDVELQTHPEEEEEFEWLMGNGCGQAFSNLPRGGFTQLRASVYPRHEGSKNNE